MGRSAPESGSYDQQNWDAAMVIVADPLKYEGLMLMCSQMVIERLTSAGFKPEEQVMKRVRQPKVGQQKLFQVR